jgi:hypothetical protein
MSGDAPRSDGAPMTRAEKVRIGASWAVSVVAFLLVWFVLLAPNQLSQLTPSAFLRIPIEGLTVVAVGLFLPARARRVTALVVGVGLALLAIVKLLDIGFFEEIDRPFNPVTDWGSFGPAFGVLRDSVGQGWAVAAVIAVVALVLALLVFVPLSLLRVTRLTVQHRTRSMRAVAVLAVVWIVSAAFGIQDFAGTPLASTSAARLAYDQVHVVRTTLHDQQTFGTQLAAKDPFHDQAAGDLLTGLRGKDVMVAFVESYGRVAVQDSAFSPKIDSLLRAGTSTLRAAGFSSRSAFLTSSTFGGISWLAHSTLQSGLWIDSQQRYDQLVATDRFTLSDAFKRAGWRTVSDVPSDNRDWPEGKSFYHYDKLYNSLNVGYVGPKFSYAPVPDQYTLSTFQRLELAKRNRAPVMAEIDLVSSHTPWAPLPHMIDWTKLGNGSVFNGMPEQGQSPGVVWGQRSKVRAAYGQSIEYSMNALISFVQTYHDNNLVLVVLGDHQPATIVSGSGASHDVPISIISHDPSVMNRISSWGWQDGLLPSPQAPVWPMDSFRDRFLNAYGPHPPTTPLPSEPPAHR